MDITDNNKYLKSWVIIASILILASTLVMIPSLAYVPLIPAIKNTIVMNFTQLGMFSGIAGLLAIVCAVPAGMAINRFGPRKVFLSGVVFMISGLIILSFARNFTVALSGRGVWQIGLRFLIPSFFAALVVSVPDKYRSRVMGIGVAMNMVGAIIVQNLGAWMSQIFRWQVSMQFFAAIVFVGGIIFFIFYKGVAATEGEETLKGNKTVLKPDEPKPRSVYSMPSVWMLCLLVIFACEEGVVDNFAVVQMNEIWKTDAVQFAWIISLGMFVAIFVNLGIGWCGDKYGRWNMLIVSGILNSMVGLCLLIGQFGNREVYIIGILLAKSLQMTTILLVNSMAPSFLGGRDIGPIIAIITLGTGIGTYIGPQVIGILRDVTKAYTAGWVYITACGVAATLIAVAFKVYFDRKQRY